MLIGKAVFDAKSLDDLVKKVEAGNYSVPTTLSREIVSFLNAMLQYNPENRLSSAELCMHPFLRKNVSELQKIDTKKVSKKIDYKGLNINIKRNQTIWSIFNENDEQILLSIKGGGEEREQSQFKKSFTVDVNNLSQNESKYSLISNNSGISNTHLVPRNEIYNNNNNYFMPSYGNVRGNANYGQNIYTNNYNNQNMNTNYLQNQGINQNMGIQPQFLNNNNYYTTSQFNYNGNNNNFYYSPSQSTFGEIDNNSNTLIYYQRQGNRTNYGGNILS